MDYFVLSMLFGILVLLLAIVLWIARVTATRAEERHAMMEKALEEKLSKLEEANKALLAGIEAMRHNEAAATETGAHTLEGLIHELDQAQQEIKRLRPQVVTLTESLRRAEERSTRDPLTGLLSRSGFEELFFAEAQNQLRESHPQPTASVSVLYMDLDGFKAYNDSEGHDGGDRVLRAFAQLVRDCFPRGTDLIGRRGGDEFVLAAFNANASFASERAQRLLLQMSQDGRFQLIEGEPQVTASIGIMDGTIEPGSDIAEIMRRLMSLADEAMYRAKRKGGNTVCISSKSWLHKALDINLDSVE